MESRDPHRDMSQISQEELEKEGESLVYKKTRGTLRGREKLMRGKLLWRGEAIVVSVIIISHTHTPAEISTHNKRSQM